MGRRRPGFEASPVSTGHKVGVGVYAPYWGINHGTLVVVVAAAPSLLLPSASQGAVEFALIIGGIIGIFTFFEYGSATPACGRWD
ncbi:MAG: hypothetical protein ABGW81_10390 [Paracoccaceae bacterium]